MSLPKKPKAVIPPTAYTSYPLRLPSALKDKLTIQAGKETVRRGQRISMNTLIVEAIEEYLAGKRKPPSR